jgi:hypothetical protein
MNIPTAGGRDAVEIQVKNNFELSESSTLPPLGSTSHGLRVVSESWSPNRDALTLQLSGAPGESYKLTAWDPGQIASVEGAEFEKSSGQKAQVRVQLPAAAPGTDPQATVVFHFAKK